MRTLMQFVYKGILDTISNNTTKVISFHEYLSSLLDIYTWESPRIKKSMIDIRNKDDILLLHNSIIEDTIKEEKKLYGVKINGDTEEEYGIRTFFCFKEIFIHYGIGIVDNDRASDVIYFENIEKHVSDKKQISHIFYNIVLKLKPKKAIFADSDFLFDELGVQVGELWPGNLVYLSNEIDIPDFEHPEVGIEYIDDIGRIYKINPDLGYDTEECKQILAEMNEHFKKHIDYFV